VSSRRSITTAAAAGERGELSIAARIDGGERPLDRAADRLRWLARGESFELDQHHRALCYVAVLQ